MSVLETVWVEVKNKLDGLQVPPQDSIKIKENHLLISGSFLTFPITILTFFVKYCPKWPSIFLG
jgi:hypothetical protein